MYCEIHPFDRGIDVVRRKRPAAIILSGGPASIYDENAPQLDREILELGMPVLGICYGLQAIAHTLGSGFSRLRTENTDGPT